MEFILNDDDRYDLLGKLLKVSYEINSRIELDEMHSIVCGLLGDEKIVPCVKINWIVRDGVKKFSEDIVKNFMFEYIQTNKLGIHYVALERDVWLNEVRYNLIYVED